MTQEEFFKRYTYSPSHDRIGGGGFGTVYKAKDNLLHRTVAIKVSEVKTTADGKKTFSLKDEFDALNHLPKHPNIANYEEFYSFESPRGLFDYAIMQYYPDGNLSNAFKQGLTDEQKEDIAVQLLEGISFLHNHKVVHRDLKPGNILIVKDGDSIIPLITDFGLSKAATPTNGSMFANSFSGGTPRYSSPEQLQGKPLRFNTDLWSYGAILYELFTGEQLFSAGSGAANTAQADMEIYKKIVNGNVSGLGKMPEKWRKVAERCLVVDAAKRAKDVKELIGVENGQSTQLHVEEKENGMQSGKEERQDSRSNVSQPANKKRHWFVTSYLVLMLLFNIFAVVAGIVSFESSLIFGLVLSILKIVAYILLLRWKKKGFWVMTVGAACALCEALIRAIQPGIYSELFTSVISVTLLFAILQIRKNGVSCWKQLE